MNIINPLNTVQYSNPDYSGLQKIIAWAIAQEQLEEWIREFKAFPGLKIPRIQIWLSYIRHISFKVGEVLLPWEVLLCLK